MGSSTDVRSSLASLALIRRSDGGPVQWLARWNDRWNCYHFVGGHKKPEESFHRCMVRELGEELDAREQQDYQMPEKPAVHLEYTAWSEGVEVETDYTMDLFEVQLTDNGREKVEADDENRWLTEAEIRSQRCDGGPVSPTMTLLLNKAGLWEEPMKVYFVTFDTSEPEKVKRARQKLAQLLEEHNIEFETVKRGSKTVCKLMMDAKGAPVVVVDDKNPQPDDADWLGQLVMNSKALPVLKRPQIVYVTKRVGGAGRLQAESHPLIRSFIKRDGQGQWVHDVLNSILDLADLHAAEVAGSSPISGAEIVGQSRCFLGAVVDLQDIMGSPYGLVTGEPGVGKLFLIRAIWRMDHADRLIVLPCGAFFKDYYLSGTRFRMGGGREAVDQLKPYLVEAHGRLLVLHHIDRLPIALQEEFARRLPSSARSKHPKRVAGIDSEGVAEYDMTVIATSSYSVEELQRSGRLIPDLLSKLRKRHVRIPNLAMRGPDDIRLLCADIVENIGRRRGTIPKIEHEALHILANRDWPQNLSDLVPVLEYAAQHCRGGIIRKSHLPKDVVRGSKELKLHRMLEQAEKIAVIDAIRKGGSRKEIAERLGVDRGTLWRLRQRHELPTADDELAASVPQLPEEVSRLLTLLRQEWM